MAFFAVRLVFLLVGNFAAASFDTQFGKPEEYRTPDCDQYKLPGCPRDLSPVCGSDMVTYPNECSLCMKIREVGNDIKIVQSGPC